MYINPENWTLLKVITNESSWSNNVLRYYLNIFNYIRQYIGLAIIVFKIDILCYQDHLYYHYRVLKMNPYELLNSII